MFYRDITPRKKLNIRRAAENFELTKFNVSEKPTKHCVERLISKIEVKSSKAMLRPGIQTSITAVIFLVVA